MIERREERGVRKEERGKRREECEIRSCKDGCNSCFFLHFSVFLPYGEQRSEKKAVTLSLVI